MAAHVFVADNTIYIGQAEHRITTDQLQGPHTILKLAASLSEHDDVSARDLGEFIRIAAAIAGIDI